MSDDNEWPHDVDLVGINEGREPGKDLDPKTIESLKRRYPPDGSMSDWIERQLKENRKRRKQKK